MQWEIKILYSRKINKKEIGRIKKFMWIFLGARQLMILAKRSKPILKHVFKKLAKYKSFTLGFILEMLA